MGKIGCGVECSVRVRRESGVRLSYSGEREWRKHLAAVAG